MKTFSIHTLGCKVNQYESRQLRQYLEQAGLVAASPDGCADMVVVNTCCVTHIASAKSRQSIRRALGKNPDAVLIVTGCLPIGQGQELSDLDEKCLIVKDKDHLPVLLKRILARHNQSGSLNATNKPPNCCKIKDKTENSRQIVAASRQAVPLGNDKTAHPAQSETLPLLNSYDGQSRAFLKVQDGCDAYCTYCIIPKIRTKVCSKDVKNILLEAQNLIEAGHQEIVLTGIFLGAYGQSTSRRKHWDPALRDSLAEMAAHVAELPGLGRLRLSSLEPADVTDRLLEVFQTHSNIAPHLHLPLQSGSAKILKKMARQYTIDQFLDVISRVKAALDRPAITTDIIVGFPGETEDDFQQTLDVCRQAGFSKIHVFSFSPRKNTPAAEFEPKVPVSVIRQRSSRLHALDQTLQDEFRRKFIGQPVEVIVENTRPPKGRCERYFMVDLSGLPNAESLQKGQRVRMILNK